MIIRQLQESDKERWISFFTSLSSETIFNRYHHTVKNTDETIIEIYWSFMELFDSLVAEVNNKIVGCIELYFRAPYNVYDGEIAITIADEYQNKGIGGLLMNEIEKVAKNNKLNSIDLLILPTNFSMKKLAKKCGYKYIGKDEWRKEI